MSTPRRARWAVDHPTGPCATCGSPEGAAGAWQWFIEPPVRVHTGLCEDLLNEGRRIDYSRSRRGRVPTLAEVLAHARARYAQWQAIEAFDAQLRSGAYRWDFEAQIVAGLPKVANLLREMDALAERPR